MRKFHLLGLALFAVFAFGLTVVSQAFALETVWLEGGSVPLEWLLVDSETLGEGLLLTDTKAGLGVTVVCSGLDEGWIGSHLENGELLNGGKFDEVTRIADLNGKEPPIECTYIKRGPCEATTEKALVDPLHLPWLTELLLVEGKVLDDIFGTGGNPGWAVLNCLVLNIAVTDECTAANASADIDNTTEGDVVALFSDAIAPELANCTQGGEHTGEVEGEVLILAASGESLAWGEG